MATPSGSNSELFDAFHPVYLSSSGSTIRAPHASRPGKKASGSSAKRAPAPPAPVGVGVGVATSTRDDEARSDPEEVPDSPGKCPSLSFGSSSTPSTRESLRDGLLDYAPSRPSPIAGSSRLGTPGGAAGEARAPAAARRGAPARWGPYRLPGGRKGDIPAAGTGVRPRPRPLAPLRAPAQTATGYTSFPPMVAEPDEEDVNYDASGSSDGSGGGGPIESFSESSLTSSSGGSSSLTLATAQDTGRFRTCRPPPPLFPTLKTFVNGGFFWIDCCRCSCFLGTSADRISSHTCLDCCKTCCSTTCRALQWLACPGLEGEEERCHYETSPWQQIKKSVWGDHRREQQPDDDDPSLRGGGCWRDGVIEFAEPDAASGEYEHTLPGCCALRPPPYPFQPKTFNTRVLTFAVTLTPQFTRPCLATKPGGSWSRSAHAWGETRPRAAWNWRIRLYKRRSTSTA